MNSPKNFIDTLLHYQQILWPVIEKYLKDSLIFPDYCSLPQKYSDIINFQQQLISDYPARKGKYLRPSLLFLTAQSMGVNIADAILPAAAMQLSEEWILIHDDIEDNSPKRRGRPALHCIYGPELAVNAGDALQVIMWKIISDINNPKITAEFYQLLNRTTLGQSIDIKWTKDNILNLTDEDVFLILESKTCYYTISGPMRLGAILANATQSQLNSLYSFGLQLGQAFQIIDDLLDLTSDFSGLKKQQYNDLYEGKRTIILTHLWRSASKSDKQIIYPIMQKTRQDKTPDEISQILKLIDKYKSIDYARQLATTSSLKAKKIFDQSLGFIKHEPFRSQIYQGIDFIINRDH